MFLRKTKNCYYELFEWVNGKARYIKYIGKDPSAYYATLEKGQEIKEATDRYPDLRMLGSPQAILAEYKRRIIDTPTLPDTKYKTIVIDPPWPMDKIVRDVVPINQQYDFDYAVMSIKEIRALPIEKVADDDCHLYLWTTQKFLPVSFEIMEYWGFKYIFTMTWHKNGGFQPFGLPQYNSEFVLFGRKGSLPFLTTKGFSTCFDAKRNAHSQKPDEFYNTIRDTSPEPRLDYFSRQKRTGFEQFGAEVGKFDK